ncbi:hypothetical protein KY321_04415 [Candidatus Woesearchaeota archaeon]|nr:hypothetical protein [Candidatus Woesearchaeota archaeon]
MKKIVKETLSPSEAVFGFAGWLTARDEPVTMSSKHDAAIVAELVSTFIEKQNLEEPRLNGNWDLIPMTEGKKDQPDVKTQIERSRNISKEMKEKILPLVHDFTRYNSKGIVTELNNPNGKGRLYKGCGIGIDKNGWFVHTHRARSKSYPELSDIPEKDVRFIKSTG